jgi:phage anti-repressor protein
MEELIKIHVSGKTGNPIVNARDLYDYLGVKQKFADWIKNLINKFGFIENEDYACIFFDVQGKKIELPKNRTLLSQDIQVHKIEYAITFDMAKELSMLQNNEKGKDARRYFIRVEKEWRASKALVQSTAETIPIPEVARMYNMGINVFRGKLRYYGILGNVKTDYKQYNRPYLKFIADGCFIGDQPTKIKGLSLINEVFRTGESLREADNINSKDNQNKVDCLYAVVRAIGGLLYSGQEGSNVSPKRQAAISALSTAMHNADELFNQNKQKSLE